MEGARVLLYNGPGAGTYGIKELHQIFVDHGAKTVLYHPSKGESALPADLDDRYDIVVVPGGTASSMERKMCEDGSLARLKTFVANGGGYIGFQAGSALACAPPEVGGAGIGLLNTRCMTSNSRAKRPGARLTSADPSLPSPRGKAHVQATLELEANGKLCDMGHVRFQAPHHHSDVAWELRDDGDDDVEILASITGVDVGGQDDAGAPLPADLSRLIGLPGIVSGAYGSGRVVLSGPLIKDPDVLHTFSEICLPDSFYSARDATEDSKEDGEGANGVARSSSEGSGSGGGNTSGDDDSSVGTNDNKGSNKGHRDDDDGNVSKDKRAARRTKTRGGGHAGRGRQKSSRSRHGCE